MAVVNKTISKYRNYHDYYDDFSCLELVNPVDQTLTGYNYIEQMLYVALEGGVAVC